MKMMTKAGLSLLTILVLLIITSCGSSRRTVGLEAGWEVLGERKVNFVRDKDVIEIRSRTPYTAIRFSVEDKDARISDLTIQFDNGDKLSPAIDEVIKAGENSRIIEISREGRVINNIEFRYRSLGNVLEGRANVLIIGRRFDPNRY